MGASLCRGRVGKALALGLGVSHRRRHYRRDTGVYGLWLVGRRYANRTRHGVFGGLGGSLLINQPRSWLASSAFVTLLASSLDRDMVM